MNEDRIEEHEESEKSNECVKQGGRRLFICRERQAAEQEAAPSRVEALSSRLAGHQRVEKGEHRVAQFRPTQWHGRLQKHERTRNWLLATCKGCNPKPGARAAAVHSSCKEGAMHPAVDHSAGYLLAGRSQSGNNASVNKPILWPTSRQTTVSPRKCPHQVSKMPLFERWPRPRPPWKTSHQAGGRLRGRHTIA